MADRLLLVASSSRLPGVLSWPAWEALHSGPVATGSAQADQAVAVAAAGVELSELTGTPREQAARLRAMAAEAGVAVWLAGPGGDPDLVRALGELVVREPGSAEIEVVVGSWDPPGAALLDAVATTDRLRSPGGCPWDARQTHESLMPFLLEEAYEAYDALGDDDPVALREELGDVLFQVLIHARLAEESDEPWSVEDVAADLVAKLVRRHPHVFAGLAVDGAEEVLLNWDAIKRAEKRRQSALDGVAMSQPALLLAHTLRRKAAKAGLPEDLLPGGDGAGERLFAAADAQAEDALRQVARAFGERVRAAERAARADGQDPSALDADAWRAYWPPHLP